MNVKNQLEAEAAAFDKRISERVDLGFIPDLRRAVKCNFFYKSFWRDPLFINLYLGKIIDGYLDLLNKYSSKNARILDVGCGAGYMALELARNGFHVDAFDISSACIREAQKVLDENPYKDGFGSLSYKVMPLDEASGEYDVVLFSVSLHHMTDLEAALEKASSLLKSGGCILCYEPCHDLWTKKDAAQVLLIRGLLTLTNNWYDQDELATFLSNEEGISLGINAIHEEYHEERDKNEDGQSPNDNEASGQEMINALQIKFEKLEMKKGHSFIYRLLGGIRGTQNQIEYLANFLAAYDRFSVNEGFMNPNGFYFIGRKR
jgi:2-polyprenyl-3-methyl-5-hydroxy-6-metoxy-1,4-benzoquinol methylase